MANDNTNKTKILSDLKSAKFTISEVTGIGKGDDFVRFDASSILKIGDHYHVWYTRHPYCSDWMVPWGSGNFTKICLATSKDGWNWTEHGQVLEDSPKGAWHAIGKHAPDIIFHDGMYYLYFSGHPGDPIHEKHIAVAVSDSPKGPFQHIEGDPVLSPTQDGVSFDSLLIDDPCVIRREGRFWMYYKGRTSMDRSCPLLIGLAFADNPTGPFIRWEGGSLVRGHTGCVWPHGSGVALIADVHPPHRGLYYSPDGRHFEKATDFDAAISDPGAFSEDKFENVTTSEGVTWGLSQLYEEKKVIGDKKQNIVGASAYIVRWDLKSDPRHGLRVEN
jgi:hypothetical protein